MGRDFVSCGAEGTGNSLKSVWIGRGVGDMVRDASDIS